MTTKDSVLDTIDTFLASGRLLARELDTKRKGFLFRGVLGELLVYRALLERGVRPQYAGGSVRNVDLLIACNGATLSIDVKEKTTEKWVRQDFWKFYERGTSPLVPTPGLADFYVYVDSLKVLENQPPDFYVLSKEELCGLVRTLFDPNRVRPKNPHSGDFWITINDVRAYHDNRLDKIYSHARVLQNNE
jgi:hypothetical protein